MSKGKLQVEIVHRRVWLWDGKESQAHQWHLIVYREIDSPETIKYTLSNAPAETENIVLCRCRQSDSGLSVRYRMARVNPGWQITRRVSGDPGTNIWPWS